MSACHCDWLASVPDRVLPMVLRHLPREALLQLRLTCQEVCCRLARITNERAGHAICFERRLRLPSALDGQDVADILRRLCSRFEINAHTWSVRLDVSVEVEVNGTFHFWCSGLHACGAGGVFAAVAATPLDILLNISGIE